MVKTNYISPPVETAEQLWNDTDLYWLGGRMTEYYLDYFNSMNDVDERLVPLKMKLESDEVQSSVTSLVKHPNEYVYFEKKGSCRMERLSAFDGFTRSEPLLQSSNNRRLQHLPLLC